MDACDSSIIYSLEERRGIIKKKRRKRKKNGRKWRKSRKYDETKPILRRVMQPGFASRAFSFPFRNEFDGALFLFLFPFFFFFLFITNLLLCSTIYRLYYYIEENQDVHVNLKNFFRKLKLIN